jgi:hypothetical protein
MRRAAALLLTAAALAAPVAAGGCGSSGEPKAKAKATATATQPPEATATTTPPAATPAPRIRGAGPNVARRWADAVRDGDFDAAAALFAVPAKVANGGRPLLLRSRGEIDFFNRTLPCGAVLARTRRASHGRFIATFQLTERAGPGANCGSGTGGAAEVRFLVRKGHIVEWLRVADPSAGDDAQQT